MHQHTAKEINGTITEKYLWANLTTLLAVYDGNGNMVTRFEYADNRMPYKMTHNEQTYYLSYDQVGTLRAVVKEDGTIVKTVEYDSFGNVLSDSNETLAVPFGFAGGLYDSDTKLTRFGYQDYDAETGKWTAKDPIGFDGGDTNLYGYVLGDPINLVDPFGWFGQSAPYKSGSFLPVTPVIHTHHAPAINPRPWTPVQRANFMNTPGLGFSVAGAFTTGGLSWVFWGVGSACSWNMNNNVQSGVNAALTNPRMGSAGKIYGIGQSLWSFTK